MPWHIACHENIPMNANKKLGNAPCVSFDSRYVCACVCVCDEVACFSVHTIIVQHKILPFKYHTFIHLIHHTDVIAVNVR